MSEFEAYKIRNSDGLFSTGGAWPKFKKTGKIWTSLSKVHSHITMWTNNVNPFSEHNLQYLECEVVNIVTGEVVEHVYRHLCNKPQIGYIQPYRDGWQQALEKYKEKPQNSN